MLKNYFKTTLRFLLKNKTYSFINIIGLALGTLCCIYILLFVVDQFSYDKHHRDVKDIYRVVTSIQLPGQSFENATASPPIAPTMKKDFPEILQYTRVVPGLAVSKHLMKYKEKSIYVDEAYYVDSTFFEIFSYHFDGGNPATALKEPNSIVLTKTTAERLFGKEDPTGKTVTMDNSYGKKDLRITGVVDESLGRSHIKANMFITMNSGQVGEFVLHNDEFAGNNFTYTYVKLRPDANAKALEKKFPAFISKYAGERMKSWGMTKQLHLQPLLDVHTTTNRQAEIGKPVSKTFLNILILIAVMIQVIACINFMNLATARASKRAKEVGVRKVIGAGRDSLMKQFLAESLFLSLIGIMIALPLLILCLPFFNQITQADIQLTLFRDYRLWLLLSGLVLITGLLAGSYPAFYLSAFQAIKVIKGNFTSQVSAAGIRRSLVVFQFVLSIILITSIIVIYSQLRFIQNRDLGFDKKQKLVFTFYTNESQAKMTAIENDFRQISAVKNISLANSYMSQFVMRDHGVYPPGGSMETAIDAQNMSTDEFFVKTNGIKILTGRDFHQNDTGWCLINETLCKMLGLTPEKAVGIPLYTEFKPNPVTHVMVAGVMKDFNYNSLHMAVKPFMLFYQNDKTEFSHMIVSVNSDNYKSVLSKMESAWKKNLPATPFEYVFLDEAVQKQYETEITLGNIINSFTLMAIIISSLGLFGLASFSAEQRSKEIGIRKVLGASVSGIVRLLSKDFLRLIAVSFVIATPIAWWAMHRWLQGFAYPVSVKWWMFALSGIIALLIAMVTVSFQSIRAAVANPTRSLKTE